MGVRALLGTCQYCPSRVHCLLQPLTEIFVIAGSREQKYLLLASELVALIPNSTLKVLSTGHARLIEFPDLLWKQVGEFLQL